MNRDSAGAAIERAIGRALCPEDWDRLDHEGVIAHWDAAIDPGTVDEAIAALGGGVRCATAPPAHWALRSREVFEQHSGEQQKALAILDLDEPLSLAELPSFVRERNLAEVKEGDVLYLPYHHPSNVDPTRLVQNWEVIRRGWYESEMRDADDDKARIAIAARTNGLARILAIAERISRRTGVEPVAAVTYLLCNKIPMLPWVSARVKTRMGEAHSYCRYEFTIKVGSPEVPLRVVAEAYRHARDSVLYAEEAPATRPTRSRHAHLLRFVSDTPGMMGAERLAAWNRLYPEWSYKNLSSMRAAISKQRRKQRERDSQGGDAS